MDKYKFRAVGEIKFRKGHKLLRVIVVAMFILKPSLHCLLSHAFFTNFVFNSQGRWRALHANRS